jgi:hypothetical protein
MSDEDDIDFRIAANVRVLSEHDVERLRGELPIVLWPLALEFPEEEGDIPSELQPSRARSLGRWEEIVTVPKAPLGLGDTFSTVVRDGEGRTTNASNHYRVHGRTPGSHHDWLVVEPLKRPALRVRYEGNSPDDRLVAEVGRSRWRLGINPKSGDHVAKAVSGFETERHGYSRDEITRALVDAHMMYDEPLPNIRAAQEQHWKRSGELYRERLRPFEWTLSHQNGARITSGLVKATSHRHALELAARDAFGDEPDEEPEVDEDTRRVWSHFRPAKVIEVRRVG